MKGMGIAKYGVSALQKFGADKSAVTYLQTTNHELTLREGKIDLYRTLIDDSIVYKAIVDNKLGIFKDVNTSPESMNLSAQSALELAHSSASDSSNDIAPSSEPKTFESGVFSPNPERMYELLNNFGKYVKAKYPTCIMEETYLKLTVQNTYFANSNGVENASKTGFYTLVVMFTSKEGEKTSSFNYSAATFEELEKELYQMSGIERLIKQSTEQVELKGLENSFTGTVIVTPECMSDFTSFICGNLGDSTLIPGTSLFKDSLGAQELSEKFTLNAIPRSEEISPRCFTDGDGIEIFNSSIINKGVIKHYLLSLKGSKKTNLPMGANHGEILEVEAGEKAIDQIISETKEGVLLCRFSGGYPSPNGDFAGVAKNSYYIKDGKIQYPINETMVSGNIKEMFKNIDDISSDRVNMGYCIYPWIKFNGINVSKK